MVTVSNPQGNGWDATLIQSASGVIGSNSHLELPQWFAVHTRCRHEKHVATQLEDKGVEVFLPLAREVRRWSDRRKLVEIPLFSCYVFVRLGLTSRARVLAVQVPGVLRFVGFHDGPAAIPSSEIEAIQKALSVQTNCSPYAFLKAGQRVRIRGGSLDGLEGILVGRQGERRLVISINLIQQSMAVVVEGYDIEPLY
jgi:transcription antitermination factor NusG